MSKSCCCKGLPLLQRSVLVGRGELKGPTGNSLAWWDQWFREDYVDQDHLGAFKAHGGDGEAFVPATGKESGKYVGYLPQDAVHFNPLFPATVEEVIRSGLVQKKSVDEKAVAQVMEELHLLPLRQRPIGHLSGGQKQRVLIARTLVRDPQLLILDEPATGVDFGAQEELMALLARLNQKRGITILMSGHDLNQLLRYAKRVVCLNRRVLYDEQPRSFLPRICGHIVQRPW